MNKIYKIIWSKTRNCYVVASELAKSSGKSGFSLSKKIMAALVISSLSFSYFGCSEVEAHTKSVTTKGFIGKGQVFTSEPGNSIGTSISGYQYQGNTLQLNNINFKVSTPTAGTARSSLGLTLGAYIYDEKTDGYKNINSSLYFTDTDTITTLTAADDSVKITLDEDALKNGYYKYEIKANGVHYYSVNADPEVQDNYDNKGATGANALAAGVKAKAENTASTAVGYNAHAIGGTALALGTSVTATGNQSVAIGTSANAEKDSSIAIGTGVSAKGPNSIAIGTGVTAEGQGAIALGSYGASAKGNGSMAFGQGSTAEGAYSTAFGAGGAKALGNGATAFGTGTTAGIREVNEETGEVTKTTYYDTAFGTGTTATGGNSTAFGSYSRATGTNSTAFGIGTTASGDYSTAFGSGGAKALGNGATAFGTGTTAGIREVNEETGEVTKTTYYDTAFGTGTTATGGNSTAFGSYSRATGTNSTAFGIGTTASGDYSTAFGSGGARATATAATAFGTGTTAAANQSTAFGYGTYAGGLVTGTSINRGIRGGVPSKGYFYVKNGNTSVRVDENKRELYVFRNEAATLYGGQFVYKSDKGNPIVIDSNGKIYNVKADSDGNLLRDTLNTTDKIVTLSGEFLEDTKVSNATAWGEGTKAINYQATAWGAHTLARGANSTAWGAGSQATGDISTAWGTNNIASGANSTAFGGANIASGSQSTAFGHNTQAMEDAATSFGANTIARGHSATAFGEAAQALSQHATAWGLNTRAMGVNSTAFTENSIASGYGATAFGQNTIATSVLGTSWGEGTSAGGGFYLNGVPVRTSGSPIHGSSLYTQDGKYIGYAKLKDSYYTSFDITYSPNWTGGKVSWYGGGGNATTAFGHYTMATGVTATAFGWETRATNNQTTAFGKGTVASGDTATAFGAGSTASGTTSLAFGRMTDAMGDASTAWGLSTRALHEAATSFGHNTIANDAYSTAFGRNNTAFNVDSTAFGRDTMAAGNAAVTFGVQTVAVGFGSVAFGDRSTATALRYNGKDLRSQNITLRTTTSYDHGKTGVKYVLQQWVPEGTSGKYVELGSYDTIGKTNVSFNDAMEALGLSFTSPTTATAFGQETEASESFATSFGQLTQASGVASTAFGQNTKATNMSATAFGQETEATQYAATAFGQKTKASGTMSTAFGQLAEASGGASTAFGQNTKAQGWVDTAFGQNTTASGGASTAFGSGTLATGWTDTALGQGSHARGGAGIAAGQGSMSYGWSSVAFGAGSVAASGNSLAALGGHTGGWYWDNENGYGVEEGKGYGSVSIGEGSQAYENYTYAIGQKALTGKNAANAIAIGNGAETVRWDNDAGDFAAIDSALAIGTNAKADATDAISIGHGSEVYGEKSIAIGTGNKIYGAKSSVIGDPNTLSGEDNHAHGNDNNIYVDHGYILGSESSVGLTSSVALGYQSATGETLYATPSMTVNGTKYDFAGGAPVGTVSVGAEGKERTITNVAAGRISATSTDAINGSQLYFAIQALNEKVVVESGDSSVNVDSKVEPEDAAGAGTTGSGTTSGGATDAGNTESGTTTGGNDTTTTGGNTGATAGGDSGEIEPTRTTTYIVTANTTTAEAGSDNLTVEDSNPGGDDKTHHYTIDLAKDIHVTNVTVDNSVKVGDKTTIEGDQITTNTVNGDTINTKTINLGDTTIEEGDDNHITYKKGGNTYNIATVEDGMDYAGDDGKAIHKNLAEQLDIVGGAADKASEYNIYTYNDGDKLRINLAKDIKGVDSVTVNKTVKVGDKTTIEGDKITVGDTVIEGDQITTKTVNGDTINTKTINLGDTTIEEGDDNHITYKKGGNTYNIATVEDGMDYAGDDGKAIHKNLAEQLDIVGGAADKASEYNIYTYNDGDKLRINLAKDIKGVDSVTVNKTVKVGDKTTIEGDKITVGDTVIEGDQITTKTVKAGDTTINNDGFTIKNGPSITKNGIDVGGKKITNVAPGTDGTDAVNVNQLREANQDIYNSMNRLDNSTRKGIAGAAALAALHPLDFDPDDKWEFSAGVGNYRGETAAAIGAFYHPNDDTIFSLGATVGNGENLVNGGVTFRFGQQNHQSRSKKAMAKEIVELRAEVAELKAMVYSMANGRMPGLDLTKSEEFPDTPENHWAYDYVSVLAGNGVLEGYQDGFFKGDRTLTRYEMAAIIYRAMMRGVDVDERMKEEFAPELARVKVDTLTSHSDGTPSIQRVRVIKGRE